MTTLVLRTLTPEDETAFFEGLGAFAGEELSWYTFTWQEGMSYQAMLDRLQRDAQGIDLAPGRVAHTMLYGFVDGKIVGRVSVRHALNENLLKRGGHIGYAVAPPYRRRGYAGEMLAQSLSFCRQLGLERVLLTCDDENLPSWRLIERFGGVLESRVFDEVDQTMARRYWIDL